METLRERIIKALNEIRPYLISDGGDIELVNIEDNTVSIKFLGNCTNCNINNVTLKSGVEMTIKKHAPEIESVIQINN